MHLQFFLDFLRRSLLSGAQFRHLVLTSLQPGLQVLHSFLYALSLACLYRRNLQDLPGHGPFP